MARSTFYYHLEKLDYPKQDDSIKESIVAIYHEHKGRYGYRRITATLRRKGLTVNHKRVSRIMRERGLKSVVRVKKYRSYKGQQGLIAPNLLNRDFKAEKPYQKWVTDITEFIVGGKKLFLSPILDLYNGEIISFTISERPTFNHVMDMLKKALAKLPTTATPVLHSDQGWQYQMKQYQETLQKRGITQSMSRKGNCLDNAIIENFFGTLKSELFYIQEFNSYESLKKDIIAYINYYNNQRIKLKLNGLSPVEYRTQAA